MGLKSLSSKIRHDLQSFHIGQARVPWHRIVRCCHNHLLGLIGSESGSDQVKPENGCRSILPRDAVNVDLTVWLYHRMMQYGQAFNQPARINLSQVL